jgi:hypothetical protein
VSPLDRDVPPAGEEIHLPGPSTDPVLLAFGITIGIVGVTTFIGFTIAGVILSLWVSVRWIRRAREDIDELPLDSH